MDYNADIPFEKPAIPGFYDTQEEQKKNERERDMFDPRKQQLARKRQGDPEENADQKRQKQDKDKSSAAGAAAAARAGQMQRIREAEQQSKRKPLNLPAPQVSESELEEIIKMGMAGDRAAKAAGEDGDAKGLVSNYANMIGATPIRTPRAPAQEDHIANEIRNIRALTETQSSLLGGENTPLHEGTASTGFDGIAPRRQQIFTPNPMATPLRQAQTNGTVARPGVVATPLRTPRDNLAINEDDNASQKSLRAKLASLPKPKETDWELELELPSEVSETASGAEVTEEDQAEIDKRELEAREVAALAELKRQTQVYQRSLPRPEQVNLTSLIQDADALTNAIEAEVARETALLVANDARRYPLDGLSSRSPLPELEELDDDLLAKARAELTVEINIDDLQRYNASYESSHQLSAISTIFPSKYNGKTQVEEYASSFANTQAEMIAKAKDDNSIEKRLSLHMGGYQTRAKALRSKILEAAKKLEDERLQLDSFRTLQIGEHAALGRRLEALREDVLLVSRREREAQEEFRVAREELNNSGESVVSKSGKHDQTVNGIK